MEKREKTPVERLKAEVRRARNALCEECGRYTNRHKGYCDGCHWKDEWKDVLNDA